LSTILICWQKTAAQYNPKGELIMAESTKGSWKDEIITVVVLAPCVLGWIDPDLARRGFDVIATLPDWYPNILYVTLWIMAFD
jgi:hypothetical protein